MAIECLVLGTRQRAPLCTLLRTQCSITTTLTLVIEGAGQEVGKSCVVVTIGGKRVMFDCGMHMGYHDHRHYPDFARALTAWGAPDFTTAISCVVITHLCVADKQFYPFLFFFLYTGNFLQILVDWLWAEEACAVQPLGSYRGAALLHRGLRVPRPHLHDGEL